MDRRNYTITKKQLAIIKVICEGNSDGSYCDLDQIIDRVAYETTKPAVQFVMRSLVTKSVAEKAGMMYRRGAQRVVYIPTKVGIRIYKSEFKSDSAEITTYSD